MDQVRFSALVDSGSMESFISGSVQRTIDFNDDKLNKSQQEKCVSIAGHPVNVQGHLSSAVKFLGSRACFKGKFLVSNNIPYDYVLGWDFISQNNLSVYKDVNLGNYLLVGRHRAAPIIHSQPSTNARQEGVIESSPHVKEDLLFCQSRFQGCTGVSLVRA